MSALAPDRWDAIAAAVVPGTYTLPLVSLCVAPRWDGVGIRYRCATDIGAAIDFAAGDACPVTDDELRIAAIVASDMLGGCTRAGWNGNA